MSVYVNEKIQQVGKKFQLESQFSPSGDQPKAIEKLVEGVNAGEKFLAHLLYFFININTQF